MFIFSEISSGTAVCLDQGSHDSSGWAVLHPSLLFQVLVTSPPTKPFKNRIISSFLLPLGFYTVLRAPYILSTLS